MKTANINNYLNFLSEAHQKGYVNRELCVKHKINTRTPFALRQLNLTDVDNFFITKESPTVTLAKKIIQQNRSNYIVYKNKNENQTKIDFQTSPQRSRYNKVPGNNKTEKIVIRLTLGEKQSLKEKSKKENKTMTRYLVEQLGLDTANYKDITIKETPKPIKREISILWGLIKITK